MNFFSSEKSEQLIEISASFFLFPLKLYEKIWKGITYNGGKIIFHVSDFMTS